MYQRILVPLDGSARAERAVPTAARLARASAGAVMLVRVATVHLGYGPSPYAAPVGSVALESDDHEAEGYLKQIAGGAALSGVPTETTMLTGPVAATLLTAVQSHHADVVVMSSHGRRGISRWALGSVAEKVARHTTVPVLVLRDAGPAPIGPGPGTERPLRLLVPLDGSPLAEAALVPAAQLAAALAAPAQGALHLVRVVDEAFIGGAVGGIGRLEELSPFGGYQPMYRLEDSIAAREAALAEAKDYLEAVADRLHREGIGGQRGPGVGGSMPEITWSVTFGVDVAEAITHTAEAGEELPGARIGASDVIAMATHGRGGLDRWALGSVTERVLHGTTFPVLVVHPLTEPLGRSTGGEAGKTE
jgi:nucleotide-binding universal stress UspA family protein